MKDYEMVMILDPGLDSMAFQEKSKYIEGRIKSGGGEILNVVHWGKRKLAYDINKKDSGYYLVVHFQTEPSGLLDFKDGIKHDQDILRYLIVNKRGSTADDLFIAQPGVESPVAEPESTRSQEVGKEE